MNPKEQQLAEFREDLRRMGPDGTEPTYSMGCQINEALCSVCGKSSSECPHISPPQECCDPSGLRSVEWLRHRDSLRDEEVMREYEIHKNLISRMALSEKQSEIITNFESSVLMGMHSCPPEFLEVMNENLEDILA